MSKIFKGLMSIVGLGGGAPKVNTTAAQDVAKDKEATGASRAALYATQGGAVGEELDPMQVKKRQTIFGN